MSRRNRGNIEHSEVSSTSNILGAIEKLNSMQEADEQLKYPEAKPETKEAKKVSADLRDLILFGKVTESVEYGGFTFVLSTLNNKQQQRLVKKLIKLENEDRFLSVKIFTLAECVVSVNNMPLCDLYDDADGENLTDYEASVEVLREMQLGLVESLYVRYEELAKQSNDLFKKDGIEGDIKN